jgi:hypothetical protein
MPESSSGRARSRTPQAEARMPSRLPWTGGSIKPRSRAAPNDRMSHFTEAGRWRFGLTEKKDEPGSTAPARSTGSTLTDQGRQSRGSRSRTRRPRACQGSRISRMERNAVFSAHRFDIISSKPIVGMGTPRASQPPSGG